MRPCSLAFCALSAVAILLAVDPQPADAQPANIQPERPRLLVLTDIGGDPDDQQSMVRLMNYANEFRIVGLLATAAGTPGDNLPPSTRPDLIQQIVTAYGQVQPALSAHAAGFPQAAELAAVVRSGNPNRGLANVGAGKSTAGSDQIIAAVDAATADDPVNITIWGGATDLAQALHDVRATRGPLQVNAFVSKVRVHAIADQDAVNGVGGTGAWVQQNFPELWYIESRDLAGFGQSAPFRGMYQNDTRRHDNPNAGTRLTPEAWDGLVEKPWVEANVKTGHGPLGALYPTDVWRGPTGTSFPNNSRYNADGVKEGDTPSWFYFLDNGLNMPGEVSFGGWGGRFEETGTGLKLPISDRHTSGVAQGPVGRTWTVARWREAFQRDFQARMDWNIPGNVGNHAPVSPLAPFAYTAVTAAPGVALELAAEGWTDPDGDVLDYRWWYYADPSTFDGLLPLTGEDGQLLSFLTPQVDTPVTLHLILEVTDRPAAGQVALTRYQRFVVTVDPAAIPEPAFMTVVSAGVLSLRRRTR